MVSGSGVFDVSGMKVTRSAARRAIIPNTTSGTWAPYTLSSTINGAIWGNIGITFIHNVAVTS